MPAIEAVFRQGQEFTVLAPKLRLSENGAILMMCDCVGNRLEDPCKYDQY